MDDRDAGLPLCVDCDGTLVRTDLLFESLLLLAKRSPLSLLLLPQWLLRGKAAFKAEVAARVQIDPALLPYNAELIEYLGRERAGGRQVTLATASPRPFAEAVARHVALFDVVDATDDGINLSATRKADRLAERFREGGFVYAGNSRDDLPVWQRAAGAIVVDAPARVRAEAHRITRVIAEFPRRAPTPAAYLRAMRPHQWLKNLLVFVPLLASHQLDEPARLITTLIAFVVFSICASGVYVVNDLLDLDADRAHPRKRTRPFAAGEIPLQHGVALGAALLTGATAVALALMSLPFAGVLAVYLAATFAYSLRLKAIAVVDIVTLAGLYTVRLVAGAVAAEVALSAWLVAFSMFIFFSLATVKRYAELQGAQRRGQLNAAGRGYGIEDLPVLMSLGTASGYGAVVVLALYIESDAVDLLYANPQLLWLMFPFLLYWISRVWMKTSRGEMHDDPVVFAARDRQSLVILAAMAMIALAASLDFP
jgi:4-hydroxybenzoate polyprenyltransferase/phosphoserine phosphatase